MFDSITFKFTLTEDDFVKAILANARSKRLWWIMWAVRLCTLIAVYFILSHIPGVVGDYSFVAIFLLVMVYGAAYWWNFSIIPRRFARSSPFLNVEVEVTASSEGMKWQSTLAKGESVWAVYISALESADHFLLFGGKNLFYLYPKRGISPPEAVEQFRELIRAHIKNFRAQ